MVTYFGVSHFSVVQLEKGILIENVSKEYEYIIKRLKSDDDDNGFRGNWSYLYIILNNDLEPHIVKRNGWSLGKFSSFSAWRPSEIYVNFKDPNNQTLSDFKYSNSITANLWTLTTAKGLGVRGLNYVFDIFFNTSNYSNWMDFMASTDESQTIMSQNKEDLTLHDIEKLKIEIEELKAKLEQLLKMQKK